MAIRDSDGNSLGGDPMSGVTVRRVVTETETSVEVFRGVEKMQMSDGSMQVTPVEAEHEHKLPRGLVYAPDGCVRTVEGQAVDARTDEQMARALSVQQMNAAEDRKQAELRSAGLIPAFYNDGSCVRETRTGKLVSVCGHDINLNSERFNQIGQGGVFS